VPFTSVIAILINSIEPLSSPIVLVLDDFQVIHSPELKQAMMYLLDHLTPSLRLVIATRADPPLPLARLRARGGLSEIRMSDLRFTEEEAREFLGKGMGLALKDEEIKTLEGRTEGWIAGLQMVALSLQGRHDTRSFIDDLTSATFGGNNCLILDYMLEEVFDRLPEELRQRLLQCSILERLCGSLCEAVAGFEDGPNFLRQVEKANLFLIAIDSEGHWYRFHHLFSGLLLHKLTQSSLADSIDDLHRRAGAWFLKNGFTEEAIRHFITARDFTSAGDAIIRGAHDALPHGANSDLLKWLEALPPEFVRGWFELDAVKAFALLYAGRLPEVEEIVTEWETAIPSAPDPEKRRLMEGNAAMARAALCDIGGTTAEALSFALRAQELLDAPVGILRMIVCHNLLKSYRYAGKWQKAEETYQEYIRLAAGKNDLLSFVVGTHDHAFMMVLRGRLNAAEALYRSIFDTAERNGVTSNASLSEAYAGMADIFRERNELEEAKRLVTEALRRAESWGYPADLLTAHRIFIRVLIAFGEYSLVGDHFRAAEEVLRRGGVYSTYASIVEAERARLIYAQGLPKEAGRWLETPKPKTNSDDPATLEQELIATARMRILHSRIFPEDLDTALALLESLATDAETSSRHGRLIEILVLRSVALRRVGETEGAIQSLGKVLGLAEPEGYVRVFLDEGELMASLLRDGTTRLRWAPARIHDYAEYLLSLFNRTS
jgi:LuxR family maltose regulon positive regulatory protein